MKLIIILVCCLPASMASAGVYKCKVGDRVVYSDVACPNGKSVDTTNGKRPDDRDVMNAYSRNVSEYQALGNEAAAASREKLKQQRCNQMARDHASWQQDMMKYPDDLWWKNRVADSRDRLNNQCKNYLAP